IFNGIASGTIAVIACAVAGSVTVLPAVLELLGKRIDRGRIPFLPHLETDTSKSRFWPAVFDCVLRRPLLSCGVAAGALVALTVPALGMHVAKPSDESLASQSEPALAAIAKVRATFPSAAEPAVVVAVGPPGWEPRARVATKRLEELALARGIAHRPFTVSGSDHLAGSIELPLTGAGDNAASKQA